MSLTCQTCEGCESRIHGVPTRCPICHTSVYCTQQCCNDHCRNGKHAAACSRYRSVYLAAQSPLTARNVVIANRSRTAWAATLSKPVEVAKVREALRSWVLTSVTFRTRSLHDIWMFIMDSNQHTIVQDALYPLDDLCTMLPELSTAGVAASIANHSLGDTMPSVVLDQSTMCIQMTSFEFRAELGALPAPVA